MIKAILYPLVDYIKAFNIFQYISFRSAYAAVTALLISFLLGPWVIRKLAQLKLGQEIRVDGPQSHLSKAGTPTMGGTLIIIAFLVSVLLWQEISAFYTWIVIVTALGFGALGFTDDFLKITRKNSDGLRAGVKFSGQVIMSFIVMMLIYLSRNEQTTLLYIPFLKSAVVNLGILYIPFAMPFIGSFPPRRSALKTPILTIYTYCIFRVLKPRIANIPPNIQNRVTTLLSAQPDSSK